MTDFAHMTDEELVSLYKSEVAKAHPLPSALQKDENTRRDAINTAYSLNTTLDKDLGRIDGGQLHLGPVANVVSGVRNWAGMSDENSRNYASFSADLEKMRNDSLRLNKGVQTEGDAQRAWNELVKTKNDPELVKQRLAEIKAINQRAIAAHLGVINEQRAMRGIPELDETDVAPHAPPQAHMKSTRTMAADMDQARTGPNGLLKAKSGKPVSPEEAAALPAGTEFIGLDGQRRVRH